VLTFFELDAEFRVISSSRHELEGYAYVHDFAFTDNHYIVYNNPVDLDLLPLMTGDKAPGQCLQYHAERPTQVCVSPQPQPTQLRLELPSERSGVDGVGDQEAFWVPPAIECLTRAVLHSHTLPPPP
jgi:carotenoid cleavage dioxygenase-like enzyme